MKTFKKLIMDELKKSNLGHIAQKITGIYKHGRSLRINTVNLFKSERKILEGITSKYKAGYFGRDEHGNEDIYTYSNRRNDIPQTEYIFLTNEFSENVKNQIQETLKNEYGILDDKTAQEKMRCWYDQAQWRLISELEEAA